MKYRIVKSVNVDGTLGNKDTRLYVWYRIQRKVLWWWEEVDDIKWEKYNAFRTQEEAENALKRHVSIEEELKTDGKIMKTFKY